MKKFILLLIVLIVGAVIFVGKDGKKNNIIIPTPVPQPNFSDKKTPVNEVPLTTIIAEGLDTPWAIAFLPEGDMLVTERQGTVRYVDRNGKLDSNPVATLLQAKEIGEGGLMGVALHPAFAEASAGKPDSLNNYVYFYYTFRNDGDNTFNRVVRMKYENNKLGGEEIIVDDIPGNSNHNGGRIKFGPDKNLYITTGDAQNPSHAQDRNSLAGKILRVTETGQPVVDNPFSNRTYTYGHRNPQGIAWASDGRLWSTEHGRSGIQSGLDEINLIKLGKNYGWSDIQGDQEQNGMIKPVINSGTSSTWAPAGADFVGNSLFFAGLRGAALYETIIYANNTSKRAIIKEHFKGEFGRVREVIKGPDGMLYITTSNRDGRGFPKENDDKIIRINPNKL